VSAPGQRHLPRQRIKIEVANVPAYSRIPRALQTNYDFLPDGYGDTLESIRQRLPEIIHGEGFKSEMARFLPVEVQERTFMKDKFCDYLASSEESGLRYCSYLSVK